MKISRDEQTAIATVVRLGGRHGFGNLISHLQTAWAKSLVTQYQMPERAARKAAGGAGYPFQMHTDLMERGEWDETGKRYSRSAK